MAEMLLFLNLQYNKILIPPISHDSEFQTHTDAYTPFFVIF